MEYEFEYYVMQRIAYDVWFGVIFYPFLTLQ